MELQCFNFHVVADPAAGSTKTCTSRDGTLQLHVQRKINYSCTDEVPPEGLLLQSQDAFQFKEALIERCKKYKCIEILDTYVANPATLKVEFAKRLQGDNTPQKAARDDEKEKIPVAKAVDPADRYVFSSSDMKLVQNKAVFITTEGYLEPDASADMREGIMSYLRTSVQGGFFDHVYTRLETKDDVAKYFQLRFEKAEIRYSRMKGLVRAALEKVRCIELENIGLRGSKELCKMEFKPVFVICSKV